MSGFRILVPFLIFSPDYSEKKKKIDKQELHDQYYE